MFERDKDELRSLGVPIDTVTDTNGEVLGYSINSHTYGMVEVSLSQEEMAACALAGIVWNSAKLSESGYMAVRKLEVSNPKAPLRNVPSLTRFSRVDERVLPILRAMRASQQVRFNYRGIADEDEIERTVDPWGVISIEGRWYVTGFDHSRQAQRTFRVSRITSEVTQTGTERQVLAPNDFRLSEAVRAQSGEPDEVYARLRIDGQFAGELLRFVDSTIDPSQDYIYVKGEQDSLVMAVLAQASHVRALEGDEVTSRVRDALSRLVAVHSGD
jgi:proteasome accessory factor B